MTDDGFPLELSYLGGRDYLHGTDLFIAISDYLNKECGNKFWLKKMLIKSFLNTQPNLILGFVKTEHEKYICLTFEGQTIQGEVVTGYIYPSERPVLQHVLFDEEKITRSAELKEECIVRA